MTVPEPESEIGGVMVVDVGGSSGLEDSESSPKEGR